ncbi:MAG: T9SS type A sorting domain-containing protein [Bacteroidetes bacterium]|nr:T9SS type A sorting domain-containing protein [Bacteroidota bacterium]
MKKSFSSLFINTVFFKCRCIYVIVFLNIFLFPKPIFAQFSKEIKFGENTWFIEDKGQSVAIENRLNEDVLYMVETTNFELFFTKTGLCYRFTEVIPKKISEKELEEFEEMNEKGGRSFAEKKQAEDELRRNTVVTKHLKITWANSNPNVNVVAENEQPHYHTYMQGRSSVKALAYKKIIYKNIYPFIDIEYTFHEQGGIKYNIILHPGANPAMLKMLYSDMENTLLRLDRDGNINIKLGNFKYKDNAPKTFYSKDKNPIKSSFNLSNNIVSFNLDNYDTSKEIIIDPFTTVLTTLINNQRAFDIGVDGGGNIYVAGGAGKTAAGYKVAKYTSVGVLVWTASTNFNGYYGDMVVDPTGNVYFAEGSFSGNICKISPAGLVLWSAVIPSGSGYEDWAIAINRTNAAQIVVTWVDASYNYRLANLNPSNGSTSGVASMGSINEFRSVCIAPNGNVYGLTCAPAGSAPTGDNIIGGNSAFVNTFLTSSGYNWDEISFLYSTTNNYTGSGYNGIFASNSTIYTTNGTNVQTRNPATGAVIASAALPGGVVEQNGGIVADNCGNIFVGSSTGVYKFNSSLVQTGFVATSGPVYDVYINQTTNEVVACGKGFVASLALNPCPLPLPIELVDFKTECGNDSTAINWTTATERNNSYFTLEKSLDGINFSFFKKIPGSGNSNQNVSYSVNDVTQLNTIVYYRLTQTNSDGSTSMLPITYAYCESDASVELNNVFLQPNPTSGGLGITFFSSEQASTTITFADAAGRIVQQETLISNMGRNFQLYNVGTLASGVYMVTVNNGKKSITRKFIKN